MSTQLLNEKQAAERLNISVQTLRRWRGPQQTGPEVVRFGRSVRYTLEGLEAYVQRCTESASQTEEAR